MKFCIITHVEHKKEEERFFAYAPYVREMNIWFKYVHTVIIVAPVQEKSTTPIDLAYKANQIIFKAVPTFELTSVKELLATIFKVPLLLVQIFKAMKAADHIHLRCPGNMGLLGCLVQILFPSKPKSAKYAGNWDPSSKQPWSYRLQKWILSNTFLTRNMQVLVYGEWTNSSSNVKHFFTASYYQSEIIPVQTLPKIEEARFVFAGSLVSGKNPQYAIELVEQLRKVYPYIRLDLYGEGALKVSLKQYLSNKKMENTVVFHGNQNAETLKKAYQNSHFVILPSKSEGWPKVIAEGMFWGCVPIATAVSCVPSMLGNGSRGIILEMDLKDDFQKIKETIQNKERYSNLRNEASSWSRIYTLDFFEEEIKKILQA